MYRVCVAFGGLEGLSVDALKAPNYMTTNELLVLNHMQLLFIRALKV